MTSVIAQIEGRAQTGTKGSIVRDPMSEGVLGVVSIITYAEIHTQMTEIPAVVQVSARRIHVRFMRRMGRTPDDQGGGVKTRVGVGADGSRRSSLDVEFTRRTGAIVPALFVETVGSDDEGVIPPAAVVIVRILD